MKKVRCSVCGIIGEVSSPMTAEEKAVLNIHLLAVHPAGTARFTLLRSRPEIQAEIDWLDQLYALEDDRGER